MNIYLHQRPQGASLIVTNNKVYQHMIENNKDEFSFGLLLFINDYYWRDGYGKGRLKEVFADFEAAQKLWHVYPSEPEDEYDDCWADLPIKIVVKKQGQEGTLKIEVNLADSPIFDILHPDEINNLIPILK